MIRFIIKTAIPSIKADLGYMIDNLKMEYAWYKKEVVMEGNQNDN